MNILAIESSCDETACSIVSGEKRAKKVKVLSSTVASSLALHSKTGGIIPENAAREQIKFIIPVIERTLNDAFGSRFQKTSDHFSPLISQIDALAVTIGPGLIGSLLVGIETAKTLAFSWNKPIIPVNHLIGHIYANFIDNYLSLRGAKGDEAISASTDIEFPAIVLIASGGHTDLILMKKHGDLKWLGGTRDDAAGEALDKIGRILNLPYPGGPNIEKQAKHGDPDRFIFPRPMMNSNDFDFSFSGLKTAVLNEVKKISSPSPTSRPTSHFSSLIPHLAASVQKAIVDVLVSKTLKAAKEYGAKSILLSGGVSSNKKLREQFSLEIGNLTFDIGLFAPPAELCTDNASMIGAAAFFNYKSIDWRKITVNPDLHFD